MVSGVLETDGVDIEEPPVFDSRIENDFILVLSRNENQVTDLPEYFRCLNGRQTLGNVLVKEVTTSCEDFTAKRISR